MTALRFEWDEGKNATNFAKHHVSFLEAQFAFADPCRVIARDLSHSKSEERFYCFGKVEGGSAHGAVYPSRWHRSHHRCRLLAKGKGCV